MNVFTTLSSKHIAFTFRFSVPIKKNAAQLYCQLTERSHKVYNINILQSLKSHRKFTSNLHMRFFFKAKKEQINFLEQSQSNNEGRRRTRSRGGREGEAELERIPVKSESSDVTLRKRNKKNTEYGNCTKKKPGLNQYTST